ncbi:MAG TPA: peptide chain release factor N(5)-glutamine methyltransferase [Atribacteraceae bacterium]|nr:peptide chain release factor N(5)-glutamine methyltransferase [Atribacteraceae bacterium]
MKQLVRDAWRSGVRLLKECGIPHPSRETRWLLSAILNIEPTRLHLYWDQPFSSESGQVFKRMLTGRSRGIPLQYVIGTWEFMSCPLSVREGVFIPRLDTESWVEEVISWAQSAPSRGKVRLLDLCCGSGTIACACAFWIPRLMALGVDISEEAIRLARQNARQLGIEARTQFLVSDLFEVFRNQRRASFDLVLSNPPYIREDEWETLPDGVRFYEPKQALIGGPDGLEVIRRILDEGRDFLEKDGIMVIEHAPGQAVMLQEMLSQDLVLEFRRTITDLTGQPRATMIGHREIRKGAAAGEASGMG